MASESEQRESS